MTNDLPKPPRGWETRFRSMKAADFFRVMTWELEDGRITPAESELVVNWYFKAQKQPPSGGSIPRRLEI